MTKDTNPSPAAKRQRRYMDRLKDRNLVRRTIMVPADCEEDWQQARAKLLRKWKRARKTSPR